MRLTSVLVEWLKENEWEERPEFDKERQCSTLSFSYQSGDFVQLCYFECFEESGLFQLYMYQEGIKCPEERLAEVKELAADLSRFLAVGRWSYIPERRDICFYASINVSDASFEPAHISNLLSSGSAACRDALPRFAAVYFEGKTAAEALAEG